MAAPAVIGRGPSVPVAWLVVLGRTSLMLYFLHHVLVLTIAHEWLGLKLDSW